MAKKKNTHKDNSTDPRQNQTNPKSQEHQEMDPNQPTTIVDPTEQLSSLKSLNQRLLKETFEKREEVSSLLESKKSLESELTQCKSEVESLRTGLNRMEGGHLESEVCRTVFSTVAEWQMVESLKNENKKLKKEKESLERSLGDLCEMEKKKIEVDFEIGCMKKVEIELRNEIKREKESLKQSIRDNKVLQRDFELQVEDGNKLRKRVVEIEAEERKGAKELGDLKVKYDGVVRELEVKKDEVEALKGELGSFKRDCDELKGEIEVSKGENELILGEKLELLKKKSDHEGKISELEKKIEGLDEIISKAKEDQEQWRVKSLAVEKSCSEVMEQYEERGRELNFMLKEKKEMKIEIKKLMRENSQLIARMTELFDEMHVETQLKDDAVKDKTQLEEAKSRQDNVILQSQDKVNELVSNLSLLQESNSDYLEMNKRLLSDIESHKGALDQVSLERDSVKKTLEDEKNHGMKLQSRVSEISKKMEDTAKVIEELRTASDTLVGEKKEFETKYTKLVEDKSLVDKKLADAHKKIIDLKALTRSKSDVFESALAMLKKTAMQLSVEYEKKGENEGVTSNDRAINGEIESYLAELEVIKKVCRMKEEKVREMKQEMESLQSCVLDEKKKSLWALISSATTILAAVGSFVYAANVR